MRKRWWIWLLLSTPAAAATFGVTLGASGAAGDACIPGTIYNNEEAVNSGNLAASFALQYSGSAVGFDNGWPGPAGSNLSGCQFSPVFAHVNDSGSAALGILRATASADMETVGLIQAGGNISVGFFDTFTAVKGGTFLLTFDLNASETATPTCAGGNSAALLRYFVGVTGFNGGTVADADWQNSDCTGNTGPYQIYGDTVVVNSRTVVITATVGAGGRFGASASLQLQDGAGFNQSSMVDASDTATLNIIGLNGATYTSDSGTDYSFTEAPEPGGWVPIALGLATMWLGKRLTRMTGRK